MHPEIQRLIDHPELLSETLRLDELDRMVHVLLPELDFKMNYTVSRDRGGEPRFDAECPLDLVPHTGLFKHLLTECRLATFCQCIAFHATEGYRCWFTLHLEYRHFEGGENGMNLAEFMFSKGKWEVGRTKAQGSRGRKDGE